MSSIILVTVIVFFYVYHDLSLPVKSETQYTLSFLLVLCVYQVWNNKCL